MSEDDGLKALGQVIQIDEARIPDHLGEMVRGTVEETLNALLDAEADRLCGAGRYERTMASRTFTGRRSEPRMCWTRGFLCMQRFFGLASRGGARPRVKRAARDPTGMRRHFRLSFLSAGDRVAKSGEEDGIPAALPFIVAPRLWRPRTLAASMAVWFWAVRSRPLQSEHRPSRLARRTFARRLAGA